MHDAFKDVDLGAGEDTVEYRTGLVCVGTCAGQDGDAALEDGADAAGYLIGLAGDDEGGAEDVVAFGDELGGEAADVDDNEAVEGALPAEGDAGGEDYQAIGDEVGLRDGDAFVVAEDAAEDIGPAAGAATEVDETQTGAEEHPAIKRLQDDIAGDAFMREDVDEGVCEEGEEDDGGSGAEGEAGAAEIAPTEDKEGQVAEDDHDADGPAGEELDDLGRAGDAAADHETGDEEEAHGDGLDEGAEDDVEVIHDCGAVGTEFGEHSDIR